MSIKIRNSKTDKFDKQTEILSHVTHVNGWFPAVYTSYESQDFRLIIVSNLSVLNFQMFMLTYPGSMTMPCLPVDCLSTLVS